MVLGHHSWWSSSLIWIICLLVRGLLQSPISSFVLVVLMWAYIWLCIAHRYQIVLYHHFCKILQILQASEWFIFGNTASWAARCMTFVCYIVWWVLVGDYLAWRGLGAVCNHVTILLFFLQLCLASCSWQFPSLLWYKLNRVVFVRFLLQLLPTWQSQIIRWHTLLKAMLVIKGWNLRINLFLFSLRRHSSLQVIALCMNEG